MYLFIIVTVTQLAFLEPISQAHLRTSFHLRSHEEVHPVGTWETSARRRFQQVDYYLVI